MGVILTIPSGQRLTSYHPSTGGGITALISAQYFKGLNYFEYLLIYETDFSASVKIELAPEDNAASIQSITQINNPDNDFYTSVDCVIAANTFRLFFLPDPGAVRTFYLRIITQQ